MMITSWKALMIASICSYLVNASVSHLVPTPATDHRSGDFRYLTFMRPSSSVPCSGNASVGLSDPWTKFYRLSTFYRASILPDRCPWQHVRPHVGTHDTAASFGNKRLNLEAQFVVHVCTCARVHVCTCARVHVCTCARVHVCTCARVHVCTCARVHVCTFKNKARWANCSQRPWLSFSKIKILKFHCSLWLSLKADRKSCLSSIIAYTGGALWHKNSYIPAKSFVLLLFIYDVTHW